MLELKWNVGKAATCTVDNRECQSKSLNHSEEREGAARMIEAIIFVFFVVVVLQEEKDLRYMNHYNLLGTFTQIQNFFFVLFDFFCCCCYRSFPLAVCAVGQQNLTSHGDGHNQIWVFWSVLGNRH
jgi:hypothetical protein